MSVEKENCLVVYGLGNGNLVAMQEFWLKHLSKRNPEMNFVGYAPGWYEKVENSGAAYENMFQALARVRKELDAKKVFGISAGGALAVRLALEQPEIEKVGLLCGALAGSSEIPADYIRKAPMLQPAVRACEKTVAAAQLNGTYGDQSRFTCFIPDRPHDGAIDAHNMKIPGANIVMLSDLPHVPAIIQGLAKHLDRF
jgi:pimeloyl-ACP methyl ester carboxylesterase